MLELFFFSSILIPLLIYFWLLDVKGRNCSLNHLEYLSDLPSSIPLEAVVHLFLFAYTL